jgi:twitching motility protein PilT
VNLLDSLLDAIVRLDGDALVMHVGEKPYVVTTSEATNQFRGPLAWGQVELSTRTLTTDAVSGMLGQILPLDQRSSLDEYGATEYDVHAANHPDERFSIVAARGGEDIWVEMRRHPKAVVQSVAAPAPAPPQVAASAEPPAHVTERPMAAVAAAPAPAPPPVEEPAVVAIEREAVASEVAVEPEEVAVEPEDPVPVNEIAEPEIIAEPPQVAAVDLAPEEHAVAEAPEEELSVVEEEFMELPAMHDREFDRMDARSPLGTEPPDADEPGSLDIDLDQEFEPQPFSLDADVEAGLLAATQEWGDDVMTEGELGELLRATAAAVITGETLGLDSQSSEQPHSAPAAAHHTFSPAAEVRESEQPSSLTFEPAAAMSADHEMSLDLDQAVEPAPPVRAASDVRIAAPPVEDDARPSRETRELAALVEYQIASDRAAAGVPDAPLEREPMAFVADNVEEPEQVHLVETPEVSVASAEGVLPVSEDLVPEHIHASLNQHEVAPVASADAPVDLSEVVAPPAEAHPAASVGAPAPVHIVEPVASESSADAVVATHRAEEAREETAPARPPAVVLPLTRQSKVETAGDGRATAATNLQRLLRLAANRGAATVYIVANTVPLVRVDGDFSTLEGEPAISAAVVERLLAEVSPAGRGSTPPAAEWLIDVPEIGRVRCLTFRDHRGPGLIFRMVPPRAIAADQLGLSAEVQALCSEADGLVLVTGGRGSGKSTLIASFVDLINRTRSDHIITTEPQIEFVHESKRSFVSQREVRGEEPMVAAVRAACREEPDVLVIEDVRSHEVAALALEAAEAGRLVFATVPGLSTASAIERFIELFPADRREKVQASLAGALRGVVSQVLLRKLRGGRVAAREVLLNTPAVASVIIEGKTFQLPGALEGGKRAGMMSFADSLASLVREGTVHPAHAYRKAPNREQLVTALRRDGLDAAVSERLG